MILVPLLNPKFATVPAAISCELRVRGTRDNPPDALVRWFVTAINGEIGRDRLPARVNRNTGSIGGLRLVAISAQCMRSPVPRSGAGGAMRRGFAPWADPK